MPLKIPILADIQDLHYDLIFFFFFFFYDTGVQTTHVLDEHD